MKNIRQYLGLTLLMFAVMAMSSCIKENLSETNKSETATVTLRVNESRSDLTSPAEDNEGIKTLRVIVVDKKTNLIEFNFKQDYRNEANPLTEKTITFMGMTTGEKDFYVVANEESIGWDGSTLTVGEEPESGFLTKVLENVRNYFPKARRDIGTDGLPITGYLNTTIEEDIKDFDQAEDNEKYDYIVDLKAKSATLTQKGIKKAEEAFGLENFNDLENSTLVHHVNQALRAYGIMKKDIDYIVKDGEVLIVDEFTGRIMYGRRYNNGLHQAIEAKEHVKIADESKTLATITFQNLFRMYDKLSGMTGTAMTEEAEFQEIYNLDVVEIPTNKPMVRKDENDVIYKNEDAKFRAVVESIKESHKKGQPVLVGTISIEKSEKLSKLLKKEGIPHEVLNAKYHEKEAEIIAQAGKFGSVTISTNMAGRGTDIMLGGNSEYLAKEEMRRQKISPELIEEANTYYETEDQSILDARKKFQELVKKYDETIKEEKEKVINAGGLKIIGTERHESRRIDNQLRGRAGRQGDVGESKFYIALDDDLMKIFGGDMITKVYNTLGADENMPIQSKMISNAVESAQKKVESRNFTIRKNVLKYDDVMNAQREIIYKQRREVLDGKDIHNSIVNMIEFVAENIPSMYIEGESNELNAEIAMEVLKNKGILVNWVPDGCACVEEIQDKEAGTYQFILMDVQMPRMNGYEATQKIRQLADVKKAQIPIIAMTANAFEEDRKHALDAGMDGFIMKPFRVDEMMKVIGEVME